MINTYLVSDLLYDNINLDQIEAIQTAYEMDKKLNCLYANDIPPLISDCLSYEDLKMLEAMGI